MDIALLAGSWLMRSISCLEVGLRYLAYFTTAFTLLFSVTALLAARRFHDRKRTSPGTRHLPPITIFKPIKGIDREMFENLASFLRQDYPRFQILFALQNPEDPALEILEDLRKKYPSVDTEIVVSKNRIGCNPKINNLANAYAFAKYDALMISDSDIRVEPDFLKRVVAPLRDPEVGMVTCFYRSSLGAGIGGILEALSVNAQFLPQALVAGLLLKTRFAMGAVMLVRRTVFDKGGGFPALSRHLADDFVLGNLVHDSGHRIVFSGEIVDSVPSISTLWGHITHLARWSRTIRLCQPGGYVGLIALQGLAFQTLYMLCFGISKSTAGLWLSTAALRIIMVGFMHEVYLNTQGLWTQLPFLPLADLAQFIGWISGFHSQTVVWRGESYDTTLGGRLVPKGHKSKEVHAAITS